MHRVFRNIGLLCLVLCIALAVSGCEMLDSRKYKKAQELFEQGSYAGAQELFAKIETYEESEKYLNYMAAAQLAEQGDFAGAAAGFAALGDFCSSNTLAVYYSARAAEGEQRYEDAQALYEQVSDYGDSRKRMAALPEMIKARDGQRRADQHPRRNRSGAAVAQHWRVFQWQGEDRG